VVTLFHGWRRLQRSLCGREGASECAEVEWSGVAVDISCLISFSWTDCSRLNRLGVAAGGYKLLFIKL